MKAHRALPLLVLFLQALVLAQDNPLTPLRQDPKVEKRCRAGEALSWLASQSKGDVPHQRKRLGV